jgi:TRAP-type C4-dicarboxylate transport system permease small subunit
MFDRVETLIMKNTSINDAPTVGVKQKMDAFITKADFLFGIIFAGVVFLNFVSAAMRYTGMPALIGADEVQVYLMVWLIFLGASIVAWRHHNLRMDVLVDKLSPNISWYRGFIESILMFIVCGVMVWISFGFVRQMIEMDQSSDGAGIPMWIPHSAVLVGFTLMALSAGFRIFELFGQYKNKNIGQI